MRLFAKHAMIFLMLFGFVAQSVLAAQSQAARMACCDPAMKAMLQVPQSDDGVADDMSGMPCHDDTQSCEGCCKNIVQQSSLTIPQASYLLSVAPSTPALASGDQFARSLAIETIPHPPNA